MADNLTLNSGSGGADLRTTEDASTKHHQHVIIELDDGTTSPVALVGGTGTDAGGVLRTSLATDIPLPAGTNAIGKLSANSGVDIGDVDVTSVIPGTGATNLGKAEDAAHTTGDTGVMPLAVRNDTLAALAGTDGDYAPLQVDADGALYIDDLNKISTNNSTTSTLTSGNTFTGTGDDVSNYAAVTVTLDSDQDSGASGMTFQFSTDNSNWDDVYTFTYTAADGSRRFQFPVTAQYFRVVYTNGGTGQTHFRVQTILHKGEVGNSVHRLGDNTDPDRSATVVKSAIIAQAAGSGDFVPVQTTTGGNLKTSVEEISGGLDIGAGNAGTETQRVSISTDDVNLSSINTDASTIAGAVSGTEMQVDIVAVTPDLMLGTDFSNVLGTADLTTTGTLADAVATTQDVLNVRNFNYVYNGTTFDFVREGSVAGSVLVDLAGSTVPLPTGAATQATLADVETNTDYGATTGNGTATGALRVTVASDSTGALTVDLGSNNDVTIDNSSIVHAEDAVHGTGDAGIMPLAVRNDTLAALAGTDGDYAPIQVNATGAVYTEVSSALPTGTNTVGNVGLAPATSGGISTVYRDEDIDETAVACKGSAGQVYWIHCINLDATPVYLHFYDVAQGSVTVGTTGELMSFAVPSQGDANGAGFTMSFPHGIEFSTAITIACTTTIGGTAGPGANEVILNVGYE